MVLNSLTYSKGKDIIIVSVPMDNYDIELSKAIFDTLSEVFGENQVVICPNDIDINILKPDKGGNPFL